MTLTDQHVARIIVTVVTKQHGQPASGQLVATTKCPKLDGRNSMAKFYGSVQGSRGEVTRLGHSDMAVRAASWAGAIHTHLFEADGVERFEVRMEQHQGKGDYMPIATGIVGDASSIKTAYRGSTVDMPDADLLRLAASAGALGTDRDGSAIAFTVSDLREFVRIAMAHEELIRGTGNTQSSVMMKTQAA